MASITKRSTANGESRYDVRWRLADQTVQNKTFRRRADAEAFRRKLEADELVGVVTDHRRGTTTFDELADQWLGSVPGKRPRSLERDESILAQHIRPVLGRQKLRTITRADVQTLVDGLAVTHAPATVHRMYSCLRAVMSFAERSELIARNPTRGIRLPRVQLVYRPILEAPEVERLAEALGSDQAPMMWLGLVLGLRWGEVAGLRAGRVDVRRQTVTVAEQLGRDRKTAPPKSNAGHRTLSTPEWLIADLERLVRDRGAGDDQSSLVFVTPDGEPWLYTSWRRAIWIPAVSSVGLASLRFHDLRSNAATALVAAGVDIKTAQTRLGHANPSLTLAVYARATVEADRRAAEAVGERFRPRDGRAMEAKSEPLTRPSETPEYGR